ncbi:hypothetical protein F0U60_50005 [Archangium minus]|uniref:Uncharacterized protein n=1 Tax=Archangium minus TaxID=83450 RepID=A0ABY9X7K9_9BACT|nr:hypothetical protein F0U60_50005 [Archangium minus]
MNNRSRFIPPLAAGLLLGAALALRLFWPGWEVGPSEKDSPGVTALPAVSTPVPLSPVPAPTKPEPVTARPRMEVAEGPQGRGTVVPLGPGDEVPEPEVANPLPQQNEPIEPEKPQTAAWRHGKLERITELLGRDIERLEQEQKEAESRGDEEEARRLKVQLTRHRERLGRLREETAALATTAQQEEQSASAQAR